MKTKSFKIGALVVSITLCLPLTMMVMIFFSAYAGSSPDLSDVEVSVNMPKVIEIYKPGNIQIKINNTAEYTHELNSIDISALLLEAVEIRHIFPEPERTVSVLEFTSYYIYQDILPGETVVINILVKASKEGAFQGFIDVCFDNMFSCIRYDAEMIVNQ